MQEWLLLIKLKINVLGNVLKNELASSYDANKCAVKQEWNIQLWTE